MPNAYERKKNIVNIIHFSIGLCVCVCVRLCSCAVCRNWLNFGNQFFFSLNHDKMKCRKMLLHNLVADRVYVLGQKVSIQYLHFFLGSPWACMLLIKFCIRKKKQKIRGEMKIRTTLRFTLTITLHFSHINT